MIEKVEEYILKNRLLDKNDKIVVGVSGGPDSLCLLYILYELKEKYNLTLFVAHVNHMIRKEADFEENFVKNTAEKLGLKFYSKKVDVVKESGEAKKSTEEYARKIRYDFFEEILNKENANKIAVAHNQNDNVETILMNLIRGTGLEGLIGIEAKTKNIVRPLLCVPRDEIEAYCKENNLTPMIDKTNFETIYTRNKIRNVIIPNLKEINPNIFNVVTRMSTILKDEEDVIEVVTAEKYKEVVREGFIIDKDKFNKLDNAIKRRVLRNFILSYRNSLKDISFVSLKNAIDIIEDAQNGDIIKIADDVKLIVNYNEITIKSSKDACDFCYEISAPGKTFIEELGTYIECEIKEASDVSDVIKDKNIKAFDVEKTGKKLYIRNRQVGDYFLPTGMTGKKKIKDFFSDNKILLEDRDKIPLVTCDKGIVWVVGMRSSREFLKDNKTKEVIILKYGKNI
ncbi:MAG: tRNA lysidine(34) synthetase TilS [Clostridia bacterium]|nr:tRNA lysidine(34) synthetase TilS [Clostridia bacterium]